MYSIRDYFLMAIGSRLNHSTLLLKHYVAPGVEANKVLMRIMSVIFVPFRIVGAAIGLVEN